MNKLKRVKNLTISAWHAGKTFLKKGAGEFLSFAMCIVPIFVFLNFTIGLFLYGQARTALLDATTRIGRDIIVCSSLDEAQQRAETDIAQAFPGDDTSLIPASRVRVTVDYADGSRTEWEKGNFIKISIVAYLRTYSPFTSGDTRVEQIVMIEHGS